MVAGKECERAEARIRVRVCRVLEREGSLKDSPDLRTFVGVRASQAGSFETASEEVFLRAHTGYFLDVEADRVQARWEDMGTPGGLGRFIDVLLCFPNPKPPNPEIEPAQCRSPGNLKDINPDKTQMILGFTGSYSVGLQVPSIGLKVTSHPIP